jgi:hypothetical protein
LILWPRHQLFYNHLNAHLGFAPAMLLCNFLKPALNNFSQYSMTISSLYMRLRFFVGFIVQLEGAAVVRNMVGALVMGALVGFIVMGALVGFIVMGALVGFIVMGAMVGFIVMGAMVRDVVTGALVGAIVIGAAVGAIVTGAAIGAIVTGAAVGAIVVGAAVGAIVVGAAVGAIVVGAAIGAIVVGAAIGAIVTGTAGGGIVVGTAIGAIVPGTAVGAIVTGALVGDLVTAQQPAFSAASFESGHSLSGNPITTPPAPSPTGIATIAPPAPSATSELHEYVSPNTVTGEFLRKYSRSMQTTISEHCVVMKRQQLNCPFLTLCQRQLRRRKPRKRLDHQMFPFRHNTLIQKPPERPYSSASRLAHRDNRRSQKPPGTQ